jgi:predicted phage terminase large subunit-like protein
MMLSPNTRLVIAPQPGPQRRFLESRADIAIYGGAAGGGKTFALMLEPLKRMKIPHFGATIFRRTNPQIRNEGGLWDASMKLYPLVGGTPRSHVGEWIWPNGFKIRFRHLEGDDDIYAQQGAQIPLIGFDELTHFTPYQFWYMLSRNRSVTGLPGRIRATTNPDSDSWVRELVDWYIDKDGYPIPERSGVIRYFVREGSEFIWTDTKEELAARHGAESVMSFTFVPARVEDNQELLRVDPSYIARLKMLPPVDRDRLLHGNWNVRETAGLMFKRQWFPVVDAAPVMENVLRYWDRAATEARPGTDPDWTVGTKIGRMPNGLHYVIDVCRMRGTPAAVEETIKRVASQDGRNVMVAIEQDPGQAGKAEASYYVRAMQGYNIRTFPVSRDKVTRAKPVSAQAEAGNIMLVRGAWNGTFLTELENFPDGSHDDQVDTLSGGFNVLNPTFVPYMA